MPIIVETPNETQTTTGGFALRTLLRDAEKFAWLWARPQDFEDVLSTEVGGLRIELIRHPLTDDDFLRLRYGDDCCGVVQVRTAPEEERRMFLELWNKALAVYKEQRHTAINRVFGLSNESIGFKFYSDKE